MKSVNILLPIASDKLFTYLVPENSHIGEIIQVPFGKRRLIGVIWSDESEFMDIAKLKSSIEKYPVPIFDNNYRKFLNAVSEYCLYPLGNIIKMAIPVNAAIEKYHDQDIITQELITLPQLSDEQQNAVDNILLYRNFHVSVLDGVTGSGKTEVYFSIIKKIIEESNSSQALILLPEISLTPQLCKRFQERFGIYATLWHSAITPAKRRDNLINIINGSARIVIGARSAAFLPYRDLRMVVIDEEHEQSYKQEEGVIYQARDMAILRAYHQNFPVILASATPSLETYNNIAAGKYSHIRLHSRFGEATLPKIMQIDMRKAQNAKGQFISNQLRNSILATHQRGEQSLLFLNRRGYAPITLCKSCGDFLSCNNCSSSMVLHNGKNRFECHYCGAVRKISSACPKCEGEDNYVPLGAGTERIAQEIVEFMPDARVITFTSDDIKGPQDVEKIVAKISSNQVDIIIGTQMIAKGHHFPNITLVGIIDADYVIAGGDLRSGEKTFQILQQVAGRSGRESKKGNVYIQTYQPDNTIISALMNNNRDEFVQYELNSRKIAEMPPYMRLASIIISSKDEMKLMRFARDFSQNAPISEQVRILGPVQSPIYMIRKNYRIRFLIKSPKNFQIQKFIKKWVESSEIPNNIRVKIDIDPYNFA